MLVEIQDESFVSFSRLLEGGENVYLEKLKNLVEVVKELRKEGCYSVTKTEDGIAIRTSKFAVEIKENKYVFEDLELLR